MELGLHSTNIPAHILDSDHSKDEIVAILCTIIILDRQWSSATGLPTHFPEGSFDKTLVATVSSFKIFSVHFLPETNLT